MRFCVNRKIKSRWHLYANLGIFANLGFKKKITKIFKKFKLLWFRFLPVITSSKNHRFLIWVAIRVFHPLLDAEMMFKIVRQEAKVMAQHGKYYEAVRYLGQKTSDRIRPQQSNYHRGELLKVKHMFPEFSYRRNFLSD